MSPSQLAPILGVSESTLKRWVDSGALRAEKTRGGHRRISLAEALAFLRRERRTAPSLEALGVLAGDAGDATPERLATLLLDGDLAGARAVTLGRFRAGRRVHELFDRLVGPAMSHIGARWAEGTIDVYQEHLGTHRAWRLLMELRGLLPPPPDRGPLALGGAPEGDPYLLPTLMASLTLTEGGWRTLDLGPDVPIDSLRAAVLAQRPRLVWVSLTSQDVEPRFFDGWTAFYDAARAAGAAVMIGGQGLTPALQDRLVASAFGTRVAHLEAFAAHLAGPA